MIINGNVISDRQTSSNLDDIEIKYFTNEELKELVTDYFNLYVENRSIDKEKKAILHGQELILALSILVRNYVDSYFDDINRKRMLDSKINEIVNIGKNAQSIGQIDAYISDLNNIIELSSLIDIKTTKDHIPNIFIKLDGVGCPKYLQSIIKSI